MPILVIFDLLILTAQLCDRGRVLDTFNEERDETCDAVSESHSVKLLEANFQVVRSTTKRGIATMIRKELSLSL